MNISELIRALEDARSAFGDVDVFVDENRQQYVPECANAGFELYHGSDGKPYIVIE